MSNFSDTQDSSLTHSKVKTFHSVPPYIKWGLVSFVFIVIFIGIYVVVLFQQDDKENNSVNGDNAAVVDSTANDKVPTTPDDIAKRAHRDKAAPSPHNYTPPSTQRNVKTTSEAIENRMSSIEEKLNDAISLIQSSDPDVINKDVQRISEELSSLAVSLNELVSSVDELAVRLSAQEGKITKLSSRFKSSRKATSTKHVRPSFSLLSIDRWGDRYSAVVELDGLITTASIGDIRAGWALMAIDSSCIDVERVKDRKAASVCISKGGG
jgi:uncharacterized protein YoxC